MLLNNIRREEEEIFFYLRYFTAVNSVTITLLASRRPAGSSYLRVMPLQVAYPPIPPDFKVVSEQLKRVDYHGRS